MPFCESKMVLHLCHVMVDGSTEETLKIGAYQVLHHIKPSWKKPEISFKVYTQGITNKLIGAWNESQDDQVLIRVYGDKTEMFIDRNAELENIKLLYEHGVGPELFATFKNGLSYSFIPGVPLCPLTIRKPEIWKSVAQQMAFMHRIKVKSKEAFLFTKLKSFINFFPSSFKSDQRARLEAVGIDKSYIEEEAKEMEAIITCLNCPIVFSHNDLLLTNIIWNSEKGIARFIDFEYGAPNFQYFDIANHFCEFAGVDPIDYSLYPDAAFQNDWLRVYLSAFYQKKEEEITQKEIEEWIILVNKFALTAHLIWGAWSMLQACYSNIDFDFIRFGLDHLLEYRKRKSDFLAQ